MLLHHLLDCISEMAPKLEDRYFSHGPECTRALAQLIKELDLAHTGIGKERVVGLGVGPGLHGDVGLLRTQRRGEIPGEIQSLDELDANDWRRTNPRFQGENFEKNQILAERIQEIAGAKGCTPAQLALAWLLAQGRDIVPIPGTRSIQRLEENAAASKVALSADDLAEIEALLPPTMVAGLRYTEAAMAGVNA